MSYSPSYSPILDLEDINKTVFSNNDEVVSLRENLLGDDNPITNPYYYAQDREGWYAEVAAKVLQESNESKVKKITPKKIKTTKSKNFKNKSFIQREVSGRAHHLIKITIHDLEGHSFGEIESDSASVNIQYLVTNACDEIMNETNYLVSKIVQTLGKSD